MVVISHFYFVGVTHARLTLSAVFGLGYLGDFTRQSDRGRVVEMRQLSKNEQTEINFDERISSTPRYAQPSAPDRPTIPELAQEPLREMARPCSGCAGGEAR
jgi:hypothetical protein